MSHVSSTTVPLFICPVAVHTEAFPRLLSHGPSDGSQCDDGLGDEVAGLDPVRATPVHQLTDAATTTQAIQHTHSLHSWAAVSKRIRSMNE